MNNAKLSEPARHAAIIAITTAAIAIIDLIARAFFYVQVQRLAALLPLLIGAIALCAMGMIRKYHNKVEIPLNTTNRANSRRVRVTGPIK